MDSAGHGALIVFELLLTRIDSPFGRAYAAYGGVYSAASLPWLWMMEGARPDRRDLAGGLVFLVGAAIILLAPGTA